MPISESVPTPRVQGLFRGFVFPNLRWLHTLVEPFERFFFCERCGVYAEYGFLDAHMRVDHRP